MPPDGDNHELRLSLTVREYIAHEIAHQREVSDIQFATIEAARAISASEVERRLGEMNALRAEIKADVKSLAAAEFKQEGAASTKSWLMPNLPAVISLMIALAALAVVVIK